VLGPSSAETLFDLGLGDRVVGVSDYCVHPLAAGKDRLGGQWNPDVERIAALAPDLLVLQGAFPELETLAAQLGIATLPLLTDDWEGWLREVVLFGARFDVPEAAAALSAAKRAELDQVRAAAAAAGIGGRPALLIIGRWPGQAAGLVVAGAASFLSEMLTAAGGRNVFADNPRDYFDLDEEALIRAAPEVIFDLRPGGEDDAQDLLATWRDAFPGVPAVRSGRVFVLTQDFILLPGPRMPQIARLFQERLAD